MDQIPIYDGQDILELAAEPMWKARKNIKRYDKAATIYRILHYFLQESILLLSFAVAVIVNIPTVPKIIPSIISGLVVLAAGAVNLVKPIQRYHIYNSTSEAIAVELTEFLDKQGQYEGLPEQPQDPLRHLKEQMKKLERSKSERLAKLNIFETIEKGAS